MNKAAVTHHAREPYAFPIAADTLKIRLQAARGDLKNVTVVYGSRYPEKGREAQLTKELSLSCRDLEHDYFEAAISLSDSRFRYHFLLDDGRECCWYNERGFWQKRPAGYHCGYFHYPVINPQEIFQTPDWVSEAVFYQIFPERFYNGSRENDPAETRPWGEKPGRNSFFGGDLAGITARLDYLDELGVNALYLTPIFQSPSNHKYNIDDYFSLDPHFGELEDLKRLVDEAHRRGIRVILDAVFNHSGKGFLAFKDLLEKGADSRYRDWYEVENFPIKTTIPVNYRTFARNVPSMPKLITSNPEVREYLLQAARYWLEEAGIDGWRLDVADEVDHYFWREFRKIVKAINSEAYIVGEVWHHAQPWLGGDQFDAVMNYQLAEAVYSFFARQEIGPAGFDSLLSKNRMLYQDAVNRAMLNLLDSHDTPRLAHLFKDNRPAMKLAVLFQMTYPGAPMVYYGDEIGLAGGPDPDCRRCMIWDEGEQDREMFSYYRKLINLRRGLKPLSRGDFQAFLRDEAANVYGYLRSYQQESAAVILNNSPLERELNLQGAGEYQDLLGGERYRGTVRLAPYQGVILSGYRPDSGLPAVQPEYYEHSGI